MHPDMEQISGKESKIASHETKNEIIHADLAMFDLELTVVKATYVHPPPDYKKLSIYVQCEFPFPDANNAVKWNTETINCEGPQFNPEFNHKKLLRIDRKKFARFIKNKKLIFNLWHYRGLLFRDICLGRVEIRPNDLATSSTVQFDSDIMDGRKQTGGTLSLQLRVRTPLEEKEIKVEKNRILIIDKHFTYEDVLNDPNLLKKTKTSQSKPSPVKNKPAPPPATKSIPPTNATKITPTAPKSQITSPKKSVTVAKTTTTTTTTKPPVTSLSSTTSTQKSTPATVATTATTTASTPANVKRVPKSNEVAKTVPPAAEPSPSPSPLPSPNPTTSAQNTATNNNSKLLKKKAESLEWLVSNAVMEYEQQRLTQLVAQLKKEGKPHDEEETKLTLIGVKINTLVFQIEAGQISLEDYQAAVTQKINEEKALAKELAIAGDRETAKLCLSRAKMMEKELAGEV